MFRLNQRAFNILWAEIDRRSRNNPVEGMQRQIARKRLEKLCLQRGTPLTEGELRETLDDLFPDFNPQVLRAAAQANRPSAFGLGLKLGLGVLATGAGAAGLVWVLNLPYPMIRWPVARTAPILLLPSFVSMDHHYRQAISLVEQADQLVNQATAAADLELGSEKVKAAQKSLDALPVWFLGYYPQTYCGWFGCTWRFTMDEFQTARKEIGRMEARLFQEKNAQTQLNQAEEALEAAREAYQRATTEADRSTALEAWQRGMDILRQVPPPTLAGRQAPPKLAAAERDFGQVAGFTAGSARSGSLIDAARQFAEVANQLGGNAPHSEAEWAESQRQWEEAIARLKEIDVKDPDYGPAQKLLAQYQKNLSQVRVRLQQEKEAVAAFEEAQRLTESLLATTPSDRRQVDRNQLKGQLWRIINRLKTVKPGTTVYAEAQALMKSAQAKLQ